MKTIIQRLDQTYAQQISAFVASLLDEIVDRTGADHFEFSHQEAVERCKAFIASEKYFAFAAFTPFENKKMIGCATVSESQSLYAQGTFGVVQEFYIAPEYRSGDIGSKLLEEVALFASERKWKRLELCTPPLPEFERTVAFYQKNGFEITGGHKMRKLIG